MDYAKKFVLVDANNRQQPKIPIIPDVAEKTQQERLLPPDVKQVLDLDTTMGEILNNKDLSAWEKVAQYNQVLGQFQESYKRLIKSPVPVKVENLRSDSQIKDSTQAATISPPERQMEHREILNNLPRRLQDEGRQLLLGLDKSHSMGYKASGELVVNGKTIEGSDLNELLSSVLVSKPTKRRNAPIGYNQFIEAIKTLDLANKVSRRTFARLTTGAKRNKSRTVSRTRLAKSIINSWRPY